MKRKFKVRFHLGKGENFMKWRVEDLEKNEVRFYSPDEVSILLVGCKLYNQNAGANAIFKGGNKTVCAWIRCSSVETSIPQKSDGGKINYNPRIKPYWRNEKEENIDKKEINSLITVGRQLHIN